MIEREWFARPAAEVARDLVGTTLCVDEHRCRVVETEAYVGSHDLACHASKGVTPRTRVLHGPAGRTYVYFVYGMHDMLNVVTGEEGHGEAVLIRAAEPISPIEGRLDGPARLCKALGITTADNDQPLGQRVWFEEGRAPERIEATPRIGVDYAGEWADAPLRFVDAGSDALSRPLPARSAGR